MTKIHFLEAALPLTKRFALNPDGTIFKDAYPMMLNFTSYEERVKNTKELHKAITTHANQGHCLIKGLLSRTLSNEPRRGATSTDQKTSWICLDFDRHQCVDIDEELTRIGLGEYSYVIQYSASQGLPGTEGSQSAHVFILLDGELPAPDLKAWLMTINFKHLRRGLELSKSKVVLRWPLDITTCQNDKLLYIAPPIFEKGLKDPFLGKRIQLVTKDNDKLPITMIGSTHINALKNEERVILNTLRKAEHLPTRIAKTSWVGTVEVQNKPDTCTVTGIKEQGDYIRLNLNGGDSWAYWHHKDNFELLHDFKSDTYYRTKEIVPSYYQELMEERQALTSTPTDEGDLILAFRDLYSAEYYNGLWNPEKQYLKLYRAKNERQLDDWMRSHGRVMGDYIPIWEMIHDPRGDWTIDEENHKINLFRMTPYMRATPNKDRTVNDFPTIYGLIRHFLGENVGTTITDSFLNWLACGFQRKAKPITAWVIHGTEGTGKGYFMKHVIRPLFGDASTKEVMVNNVEDNFNDWLLGQLFINVNEIDVDDFKEKGRVSAKFKSWITDSTLSIRRMRTSMTQEVNYALFLFASNKPQPVYIPLEDRRYNVGNYQSKKIPKPDDDVVANELMAFAEWLLAHKADHNKASEILQTEARERIQKLGVTSITETANIIREGDFDSLWMSMPDERLLNESPIKNAGTDLNQAYTMLMKRLLHEAINQPKNTLSRDEMLLIFQYNVGGISDRPNKFTSLLRHNGIETVRMRRNGQSTYGIHVNWKISDELKKELMAVTAPKLRKIK